MTDATFQEKMAFRDSYNALSLRRMRTTTSRRAKGQRALLRGRPLSIERLEDRWLLAAELSVTPTTWDIIGMDHNDQTTGPDTFLIGARIENIGDETAINLSATINLGDTVRDGGAGEWVSEGTHYIDISSASTYALADLAAQEAGPAHLRYGRERSHNRTQRSPLGLHRAPTVAEKIVLEFSKHRLRHAVEDDQQGRRHLGQRRHHPLQDVLDLEQAGVLRAPGRGLRGPGGQSWPEALVFGPAASVDSLDQSGVRLAKDRGLPGVPLGGACWV